MAKTNNVGRIVSQVAVLIGAVVDVEHFESDRF